MLNDALRDLRHAVRLLSASRTFTLVAALTLSLGIGANTAIFSVVQGLLLRPLPYAEPDRLMFVDAVLSRPDGETSFQLSYADVATIRSESRTLAGITPWNTAWGLALEGTEGARRLEANFVGADYFSILGATPLMGRAFSAEDHATGGNASPVVMLSEACWRQEFGRNPSIVGTEIRLQNRVFVVVGVMPASFSDVATSQGDRVDVWSPIERVPELFGGLSLTDRASRQVWAVARVKADASVESANAELATIGSQLATAFPASNANFSVRGARLDSQYFAEARQPLWFLLAGSVFVLLIACANVANLLLVRASDRAREFAVRQAIGASTGRIVRQLLAESVVLAGLGAAGGLVLASWMTPALMALSGIEVPAYATISVNGVVLTQTILTALACGLLFGLAPVWRAVRTSVRDAVGSTKVARASVAGRLLAGAEITAAFVLAAAALLMLQSFSALTKTDLQFRADRLLTARLELPQDRYPTPEARARAGQQMLERLQNLPGVEHAAIWGPSMFGRSTWVAFLSATDRVVADTERLMVWRHNTNPGALANLGIRLVSGRDFSGADRLGSPMVAILSEATAARMWPGQDAVGRQLRIGASTTPAVTVIGVAADARHRGRFRFSEGASAYEPQLDIYLPYAQRPGTLITYGVRTKGDPDQHANAVRAAINAFDSAMPIYDVASLDSRMRTEEAPLAFATVLLNVYGGLALLLAAIGVYGVLAAAVVSRNRELGIRAALGAEPRRLVTGVVSEGLAIAAAAVALGSAMAWALSRMFGGLLFGVAGNTTITLVGAAAILIAMAACASLIPARRASKVDPISALRSE